MSALPCCKKHTDRGLQVTYAHIPHHRASKPSPSCTAKRSANRAAHRSLQHVQNQRPMAFRPLLFCSVPEVHLYLA